MRSTLVEQPVPYFAEEPVNRAIKVLWIFRLGVLWVNKLCVNERFIFCAE